jgi:integrase
LNEVVGARWREFDLQSELWTVPAERFKSQCEHRVQLGVDAMALLAKIPRFAGGDYLFSARHGKAPITGISNAKDAIDALMGDVPHWTFHDIRRTVRTRLAKLKIEDKIAEMVIGHQAKTACSGFTISTSTRPKCTRRSQNGRSCCAR